MIHLAVLAPLVVAGGGLIGYAHERFRRKRLVEALSAKRIGEDDGSNADEIYAEFVAKDDLVELKFSERAARIALGLTATGLLFYPPIGLLSLPFIGYSGYNWLRARYPTERDWSFLKAPSTVLAITALSASLLTGYWIISALVLILDLRARKNWASPDYDALHEKAVKRIRLYLKRTLVGEPRWEWFPILLARVSLGLFFAISGFNKLFVTAKFNGLVASLTAIGLPFPTFLTLLLASTEFYGGTLLALGLLSTLWAFALAFAMVVAIITVEIPMLIPPGLGPLLWLDWFLYLPQVMYVILFVWLMVRGPGPHSVDALIARKLGFDGDKAPKPAKKAEDDKAEGPPETELLPA
ncbi:MAG: DoxX family protein [Thiohalocapsa sp.]